VSLDDEREDLKKLRFENEEAVANVDNYFYFY
jgi:hypothetical protein